MTTTTKLLIAGCVAVFLLVAINTRYDISNGGYKGTTWVIDRWTGEKEFCSPTKCKTVD